MACFLLIKFRSSVFVSAVHVRTKYLPRFNARRQTNLFREFKLQNLLLKVFFCYLNWPSKINRHIQQKTFYHSSVILQCLSGDRRRRFKPGLSEIYFKPQYTKVSIDSAQQLISSEDKVCCMQIHSYMTER